MFHQFLTPIGGSLGLSFIVGALPIIVVLVLLGVLRRPGWQAALAGLITGIVIAIVGWHMPVGLTLDAAVAGGVFALWPIMWIVVAALTIYNVAIVSGRFDAFRDWILDHLPDDRRVVLVVLAFSFGALLEGIAGFGTPVAIISSVLIMIGWAPLEALTYTLIFDTAPVAFGALGVPITVLGTVTHLPDVQLGQMVGRQLPLFAFFLPFYVMFVFGGLRSVRALAPFLFVAGGSFAVTQFITANYINYRLTDVLASLVSLVVSIAFLQVWKPAPNPEFAMKHHTSAQGRLSQISGWQGWLPWALVSAVVIIWTSFKIFSIGEVKVPWPGLDHAVFITLYGRPYAAIWDFQPLATGTAIFFSAALTAMLLRVSFGDFISCFLRTFVQLRYAIITVVFIIGLAYVMNYGGMTYTLGKAVASLGGILFPLASAFLGWIAVFLSGSDTSGNALFGNLQVVAANQLKLNPVLFAATNSSGGVMGKMISPQNIATGVSVTDLVGQEGKVFSRTFKHSVFMTLLVGILALLQQYILPWMIPPH
ncbi:MAG: L-lactate permease [Proteobacteria bacterium]|nr:L-lactate permease [Pseudomonadota bacterium]